MDKVTFSSVPQMRAAVTGSGSHFFDRKTMQHWGTKIHGGIKGGHYFITSDWAEFPVMGEDRPRERAYKVRWFEDHNLASGMLSGEQLENAFPTLAEAQAAVTALIKADSQEG